MPRYQVIYTEFVTEEQFAWEDFAEDASGARTAADEHFFERLEDKTEGEDYSVQVNEMEGR